MKWQAMVREIQADLRSVHIIFGMYGVGCQVKTVTGDSIVEVRGEKDEGAAVRAAYEKWKRVKA